MLTTDRVLICLLISSHVYCILGSMNVALNKPTWQSSMHSGGVSSRAVDGNTIQVWSGGSCTHTDNHGHNWLCVDLQQSFEIRNIKIFNRLEGRSNEIIGFEIRLSSTGHCDAAGFASATQCYKDHRSTALSVYTIERCNQPSVPSLSARLVFVSVHHYLMICELQIFTENCPVGFYGTNCHLRCPANCTDNVCGKMIGSCSNGCQGDLYGSRCEFSCSTTCKNGKCNARTAKCTGCKDGYYGDMCESACNTNCQDDKCDWKTGKCTGCKDGYYGDMCEESCSTCNGSCRQLDGVCLTGCKDGYWGCNGLCLQTCSYCNSGGCRIQDGVCHNPRSFNSTSSGN